MQKAYSQDRFLGSYFSPVYLIKKMNSLVIVRTLWKPFGMI